MDDAMDRTLFVGVRLILKLDPAKKRRVPLMPGIVLGFILSIFQQPDSEQCAAVIGWMSQRRQTLRHVGHRKHEPPFTTSASFIRKVNGN